jgi:serine protease Do
MQELDAMLRKVKFLLIGLTLVSIGLVAGLLLSTALPDGVPQSTVTTAAPGEATQPEPTKTDLDVPGALTHMPDPSSEPLTSPFVELARKVVPAVVSVESRRTVTHPRVQGPQREFFRRLFPDADDEDGEIEVPSSGSGFIFDESGYVLTNHHVVAGSEVMDVHLADGRTFEAYLIGTDPGTDVAIVKLDLSDESDALPTVPLGNSDEIRVGDWAIAIGNPLGELEGTLTVGIISAKGRKDLRIAGGGPAYQDFLQTDASINFGNSGGPLVNARGEVIGINSAINPTGQGLGFTIPINLARRVAIELIESGTIRRGYLGILPQEVTQEIRDAWEMPALHGILVGSVSADTPAKRSGLEVGDIIMEFDGADVASVPEFRALVADAGVGVDVPIRLLRQGDPKTLHVVLAERPDTFEPPARRTREVETATLGATFEEVSPDLVDTYRLEQNSGVVITDLNPGGAGLRGGLREGDIVLEINKGRVQTSNDAERELRRAERHGKPVVFLVLRGDMTTFVSVRLER